MAFCLQCNKWVPQIEGKKKREFCNNTCRSNYWYAKNKKGKAADSKQAYDGPKFPSSFQGDEPLSFKKLSQQEPENSVYDDLLKELQNAEAVEDLERVGRKVENSKLPFREKKQLHDAGKEIFNKRFKI